MVMPESPKESALKKQLDQIIWDKWSKGKKSELKPSGLGWIQDAMPWKAEFKRNVLNTQPFVYRAEGKHISFKPAGLWWTTPQGPSVIKQGVSSSIGSIAAEKVRYSNALGAGIGLEASVGRTTWRKSVTIESLGALGTIPVDAEFLEIGFEIETDFDIEGWDKKSELEFTRAIRLSELSQLESIKAWDRHIVPEPLPGEEPEDPLERCSGFFRVVEGKSYLIKQIPVEYLKQAVYPVITDTIISYGSEYTFNAAVTPRVSCTALDATHFVVAYKDDGDLGHGKAKIGVVTGNAIAYGSEYEFNASTTLDSSCEGLDATHFVVGYRDGGDSDHGKAKIGVVTGNAIAYGSEYEFNAAGSNDISCAALDATNFVVGYRDSGDAEHGKAKIGVVTGNAIAYGAVYEFNAAASYYVSCAGLDATHFVVGYFDQGGDGYAIARIGVVTGNAIAYGSEYEVTATPTPRVSCTALDSTHFVIAYRVTAGGGPGKAKIGVVTGNAIAYGLEYEFNADSTYDISCATLDSAHFVVGYRDDGDLSHGKAKIGVVTGNAIAFGLEYEFNAATSYYVSCAGLDATNFVVGYHDQGGDEYGIARIGTRPTPYTPENKSANMGSKMVAAGLI